MLDQLLGADVQITEIELRAIYSLATIVVLWVARRVLLFMVGRRIKNTTVLYHWSKYSAYGAFLVGAVLVGRLWFEGLGNLTTLVGLVSAGLAIALKDLVSSLAGWVFIFWRRPFEVGDRIEIGQHRGDVIDVRVFQFTLMEIGNWVNADQSTGRVIHVPNSRVFVDGLANYSKGFWYICNELPILVTFESNWRKAKQLLEKISTEHSEHLSADAAAKVRQAAQRFLIRYDKLTPIVYTSVEDSGVMLTIRYLCDPRKRRTSSQEIWEEVLDAFAAADDIDFAYPTRRLYDNASEGKPGARADSASPG